MKDFSVILLAAGKGTRMNLNYNKVLYENNGKPLFMISLEKFRAMPNCKEIILVINKHDEEVFNNYHLKNVTIVFGGLTRQDSVANGLAHCNAEYTLVHDAARPNFKISDVENMFNKTTHYKAMTLGVKVKDTIKRVNADNVVLETLNREELYSIQTPQLIKTELLREVHIRAREEVYTGTDDVSLVEKYSEEQVFIVDGSYDNIKITTQEDLWVLTR